MIILQILFSIGVLLLGYKIADMILDSIIWHTVYKHKTKHMINKIQHSLDMQDRLINEDKGIK